MVTYLRVQRNVDSMIELKHVAHFQALSMIARSIFELSVDLRLMQSVPEASERMRCFQSLESLRAVKAAVKRSNEPNGSPVSKTVSDFDAHRKVSIEARATQLWGAKFNSVTHWSGFKLGERVSQIADDQISHVYIYAYRTMSWQTHPGLQGSYGLPASAFPAIANSALNLAVFSYLAVLRLMISTLGLQQHDRLIYARLNLAHTLPYTDGQAEELELRHSLGL